MYITVLNIEQTFITASSSYRISRTEPAIKYICDDEIHLSEEGSMVCAKQVVQVIKDAVKSF